ncbi:VWA domain-containing protein [Telmatospirillum sp.]|uniref:nitric oxide reductase activation protein NorD n=1 Tax=Telmatospirillum sp. TaxID=2079197 RepID=UPI0028477BBF|nr:VWA domain-containing protein [Telmatospirillum sp.]MDR3435118.1 VWA domain-containing protein [Telmatospirillum sp.]
MTGFLELEEQVGKRWHRLVGGAKSWQSFPNAAVTLDSLKGPLAVFFRGLGGDAGVVLAGGQAASSGHRLSWRQRLGSDAERLEQPRRDGQTLAFPPVLDLLPSAELNRSLYFWLATFFAHLPLRAPEMPVDPLQADLQFLRRAHRTSLRTLAACPGIKSTFDALRAELAALRPCRDLPPFETEVEKTVCHMLDDNADGGRFWPVVAGTQVCGQAAPARYKTFLPVPLWGDAIDVAPCRSPPDPDDSAGSGSADARDGRTRKAQRRSTDQPERKDSLILNRFEKILTLIESLNINRAVDDDDEDSARKALDDAEEISLSAHRRKPATRLAFDLDLPPEAVDVEALAAALTYPEWHYRKKAYLPDYCRVICTTASEEGETWQPSPETHRRIRQVRRQFEALRPRHEILRGQLDGPELDLEALIRARSDLRASGVGSDRVYQASRRQARDLAVLLLVDVSLSTDGWIDNRRILDVEKEALAVLANGLAACGDDHAILTFTSRRRDWVRLESVKDFDEPFSTLITRRIAALKPGFYTRIGAALRHAVKRLDERPNRHRLIILLTDGKPNDIDHYEGRYGIEDTRRAVQEARRAGVAVFGVTIDRRAQDYFPTLFGRGGYAIINHIARLPSALPTLYRHLVGS